jgi:hypothetical protein
VSKNVNGDARSATQPNHRASRPRPRRSGRQSPPMLAEEDQRRGRGEQGAIRNEAANDRVSGGDAATAPTVIE